MTAIRHTLQKDVFLPNDERLLGVVHVSKAGKKKKASFLCAAATTEKPVQVSIVNVKKSDKGDTYKRRQTWQLRELKLVDGKDDTKLCQRYLIKKRPDFVNVNPQLLEEAVQVGELTRTMPQGAEDVVDEEYQVLTAQEESDLEKLISQCDFAVSNAEAFTEQLSKDLSMLDGANIHSIMASEEQVKTLMKLLEVSETEINRIEKRLERYEGLLEGVREQMEQMKGKDTLIQMQNTNYKKLLSTLDTLVGQLDLSPGHVKALHEGDLSNPSHILDCTSAAEALQQAMGVQLHPGLCKMQAVREQQKMFEKLRSSFARRLATHLNSVFVQQGHDMGETLSHHTLEPTLPKHYSAHRDLMPYADLMLWLKGADITSFHQLAQVYTSNLKRLYDREIKEFFEAAKSILGSKPSAVDSKKFGKLMGSTESLGKSSGSKLRSSSLLDIADHKGSNPDITDRAKFERVLNSIMSELEPVCMVEQDFIIKFFHLSTDSTATDLGSDEEDQPEEGVVDADGAMFSKGHTERQAEKQVSSEVRRMMSDLFGMLEPELHNFINHADKMDPYNSMYMLVKISAVVMGMEEKDAGSYLATTLATSVVIVKRNFDKLIQAKIQSIEDIKVPKNKRCGILPFVASFEEFAELAETVFKGSERRADLDKAYGRMVRTIFDNVERVGLEHQKTPQDVVLFENFHHLNAVFARLKITCLETEKKEARHKYKQHLNAYVINWLGHPMEKLNHFFEGIEARVAQGVKAEEVGYQLAFSKQELRKVIKEYPMKEVKKGLDSLYKKVEKHLCEEENLNQVVWRSMQEEFISQYKHFEDLIRRCYPESGITLEFTIDDILKFFSDIAQSH
ncbi:PREDICTED: exocyst complex component 1-like [Branchiostoma belcheri]|uniref:Exocyst complex component 1-like n=1 Tax=Branchiostoma belcheri TaxID=7741 RepID=A0A6P5AXQ9_BRABE|nr:PREDICTED: exocyst complex component 1-like [Branchiostoma belcheri]